MQSALTDLAFQLFKQSLTMKSWKVAGKAETCPCFKGDLQNKKSVSLIFFDNVLTKNWKSSGSFFPFSVYQFLSSIFRC